MTPALAKACKRAMHVIAADGRVLRAGAASVFLIRELGRRRVGLVLGLPPFRLLMEVAYWFVARNRRAVGSVFRKGPPGYDPDSREHG